MVVLGGGGEDVGAVAAGAVVGASAAGDGLGSADVASGAVSWASGEAIGSS
jgi:hypothetical protein